MTKSKRLHDAAWRIFKEAGLIPDDGRMWVLHHIDANLKSSDPKRYHEWRPEDLVPITQSDHAKLHGLSGKGTHYAHLPESNAKRAESNRHPRDRYVIRQSEEERAAMKKRLSEIHAGNKTAKGRVWVNNGIISLMVFPDEIPPGFRQGRIYRRKAL